MSDKGLVYVGKVVQLVAIPEADLIQSATVVCGEGGKWRGVVKKDQFHINELCVVYLPDALIPENDDMRFMEKRGWRVRMCKFRGAPSEVLIMPCTTQSQELGADITQLMGVTKYFKPVPANLQGKAKGDFPGFIPKTDELNYQSHGDLVDALQGKSYYITEKADGSSTTAYKYKGEFGICSRHYDLLPDENNGYWQVAAKYQLQERLPEGYALQWETCGPKIQSNPMGLKEVDGFAFSGYNIREQRYLTLNEFRRLCKSIKFPMVKFEYFGQFFDKSTIETLGEGTYSNGKQREGVVVRSQQNFGSAPISFKVINLNYEK